MLSSYHTHHPITRYIDHHHLPIITSNQGNRSSTHIPNTSISICYKGEGVAMGDHELDGVGGDGYGGGVNDSVTFIPLDQALRT